MTRVPSIQIQKWTAEGPAYTVHRRVAGWRNRAARRAGQGTEQWVGPHDLEALDDLEPAASLLWAADDMEAWGFRAGHVYDTTLLIDGDAHRVLVDAREGDRIETYAHGLELLEHRAIDPADVDEVLAGDLLQPSNVSDGTESQDPHPGDVLNHGPEYEAAVARGDFSSALLLQSEDEPSASELTDAELEALTAPDTSPEGDEDAVGGDGDTASGEEG